MSPPVEENVPKCDGPCPMVYKGSGIYVCKACSYVHIYPDHGYYEDVCTHPSRMLQTVGGVLRCGSCKEPMS